MIKIYSGGEKITYTKDDDFELSVSSTEDFDEGSVLKFQVAKEEQSELLIDASYLLEGSDFNIILTDEEKEKLSLGGYMYKLVLVGSNGKIATQKSGELIVKWGA